MGNERTRRTFLAGTAATAVGLAGCLGGSGSGGGDGGGGTTGEGTMDGNGTTDGDGGGFGDHASTNGIGSQPYLGPAPGEATGTIVAFEDPSCTRCRTFERQVFPEVKSKLIEAGDVTFVFRGYPVVYPWGEPASHLLEATFARSEDAFWALKEHYYAEQDTFSTDNVHAETESFLNAGTDLDGSAVVEAARKESGDAAKAVQVDLDAGKAAGTAVTPTLYLFRDGNYQTNAKGSVDFSVLKATLGV